MRTFRLMLIATALVMMTSLAAPPVLAGDGGSAIYDSSYSYQIDTDLAGIVVKPNGGDIVASTLSASGTIMGFAATDYEEHGMVTASSASSAIGGGVSALGTEPRSKPIV